MEVGEVDVFFAEYCTEENFNSLPKEYIEKLSKLWNFEITPKIINDYLQNF